MYYNYNNNYVLSLYHEDKGGVTVPFFFCPFFGLYLLRQSTCFCEKTLSFSSFSFFVFFCCISVRSAFYKFLSLYYFSMSATEVNLFSETPLKSGLTCRKAVKILTSLEKAPAVRWDHPTRLATTPQVHQTFCLLR